MQHRIVGTTMPVLEFALDHNDAIISEAGELSWMSQSIQMTTHTQHAGGGGFLGALKRVAGGGTLFMTEYRAYGAPGEVAFATRVPGHIVPVEVASGHDYMVHRHGFLCATAGIALGVGFQQSLGAGIFGGDGFLLQKKNVALVDEGECGRECSASRGAGDSLWERARPFFGALVGPRDLAFSRQPRTTNTRFGAPEPCEKPPSQFLPN